jgi:exonuclease VII small subunit
MKELARGERTASALENHLDSLEKKIEELLAQAEKAEKDMQTSSSTSDKPLSQDQSKSS